MKKMRLSLVVFGLLLLLGVTYSAPISKVGQAWIQTKSEGFTGLYEFELTDYGDGTAEACWKVPTEIKGGRGSELKGKSGLSTADFNAELAKVKNQDLKDAEGRVIRQLDMSKDGCWILEEKYEKQYRFGSATVEFTYENILITVDMLENTDACLIDCHTDYSVCSNATITPEVLDAVFIGDVNGYSLLQYRNFTYNETHYSTASCNPYTETYLNGTNATFENCTSTPYSVEKLGWAYFEPEEYGGCARIRVAGTKAPMNNVDNILSVYGVEFPEWAWWNSTWLSYREINITDTDFTGAAVYFNITFPTNINGEARFTTNSSGTETECGGWWKVENQTNEMWILNCTLANGTTSIRGYYNNNTAVSDLRNINESCKFADDFEGGSVDTTKWNLAGSGVAPSIVNGKLKIPKKNDVWSKTWTTGRKTAWALYAYTPDDAAGTYFGLGQNASPWHMVVSMIASTLTGSNHYYGRTYTVASTYVNSGASWADTYRFFQANYNVGRAEFWVDGQYNTSTTNVPTVDNIPVRLATSTPSTEFTYLEYICFYDDLGTYGYNATFSAWGAEINITTSGFTNQNITLGPATLYKNSTAYCEVNWTHDTEGTFNVYLGLRNGTTVVDDFNESNLAYTNGTIWNYTGWDISRFTHGENLSCWSYAYVDLVPDGNDTSATVYSSAIELGNLAPVVENLTITTPLYNGTDAVGAADFYDVESDAIHCKWEWFRNSTALLNISQSPCTNTSTLGAGNYSATDILFYRIYANDSLGANSTMVQSANTTVSPPFVWNNYTYTATQYETTTYAYTLNFSLPIGDENGTARLEYNGANTSSSCANVSNVYYCTLSIPAPPVSTNGTAMNGNWFVSYDSLVSGAVSTNQSFSQNVYLGIWATGIASSTQAISNGAYTLNVSYANVSGYAGTTTATGWLLGATAPAALSCSAGLCTASLTAPSISAPDIYQTMANLTLTSSYWGTSATRTVFFTGSGTLTAANATMTTSGTITNPNNANDSNWGTYATLGTNAVLVFNYSLPQIYTLGNYNTRIVATYTSTAVPEECWGTTPSFKVERVSTAIRTSCYNHTSEDYSQIHTITPGASYFFYEQNATFSYNNTNLRVVPFGLTDCTVGAPFLNYSCWAEGNRSSITCDYSQTFIVQTTSGGAIETFSGSASSWNICVYPPTLEGNISSTEEYGATGYDTRFYYLFDVEINASTSYDLKRYIGSTANTKLTFPYVKRNGAAVQDVYVYAQRLYVANDSFETVGMGKTDTEGKATMYVEPNDAFYRFVVVDEDGTVLYTSGTQQVGCSPTAAYCTVTLNIETTSLIFWEYYNGAASTCTFSNTTKILSCDFVVGDGTSHLWTLDVYKWTGAGRKDLNCTNSLSSAAGTVWCDLGDENTTGMFTWYFKQQSYLYIRDSGEIDLSPIVSWGAIGLFGTLVMVIIFGLAGTAWGPSAAMVTAYLGLLASWFLKMITVPVEGMLGLAVLIGVLLYAIKR